MMIVVLEMTGSFPGLFQKKAGVTLLLALLAVLIAINVNHSEKFKNQKAFWENAAGRSPHHPMAHLNLGAVYVFEGNEDAALAEFQKAVDLNGSELSANNNIALIYGNRGDAGQAKKHFEREIRFNPGYATAHFNYGLLHFRENNPAEAIRCWVQTIGLDPDFAEAYYNLSVAYDRLGDKGKSDYYLEQFRRKHDESGDE
jgi:tetratricopeptide (TPR) repeat protein